MEIVGDLLVIVADDGHHIALFPREGSGPGEAVRVLPGDLPGEQAEGERRKPDFEAVAALPPGPTVQHGVLLLVGSGSTPQRERPVLIGIDDGGALATATSECSTRHRSTVRSASAAAS